MPQVTPADITQALMAVLGLSALSMAYAKDERIRKWSPVVGLCSQPAWLYFAISVEAWGLLVLSLAYTLVYLRGVVVQFWGKR